MTFRPFGLSENQTRLCLYCTVIIALSPRIFPVGCWRTTWLVAVACSLQPSSSIVASSLSHLTVKTVSLRLALRADVVRRCRCGSRTMTNENDVTVNAGAAAAGGRQIFILDFGSTRTHSHLDRSISDLQASEVACEQHSADDRARGSSSSPSTYCIHYIPPVSLVS